jgi:hypothetical protein
VCSRITVVRVQTDNICYGRHTMWGQTVGTITCLRHAFGRGDIQYMYGVDIQCGRQTVGRTTCLRHAFGEGNIQYMYEVDIQCEGQTVGKTTCPRHTFGEEGTMVPFSFLSSAFSSFAHADAYMLVTYI